MCSYSKKYQSSGLRILMMVMSLAAITIVVAAAPRETRASTVYLKNSAIITDSVIRLGDLFEGLDDEEEAKVLGPAPTPGKDMILNARTLLRVALALDLPWRPTSEADRVILKRAATVINDETLKQAVAKRLKDEGFVNVNFDIQFTTSGNDIILPHDMPPTAEVIDFSFSPNNNWFQVTFAAPSADNPVRKRELTGAVRKIVEVPVLKDNLRNGDVIRASDVEWIQMYAKDIQHDYLLRAENILGMTPRRMVMARSPIREIELESPKLVERGDTIVILFEQGTLRLTAEGRALRGGAKGDYIRVVNNNSSRTVEGIVTGERMITVK